MSWFRQPSPRHRWSFLRDETTKLKGTLPVILPPSLPTPPWLYQLRVFFVNVRGFFFGRDGRALAVLYALESKEHRVDKYEA